MSGRVVPFVGGEPEPWATEWGEDEYGFFTSFRVAGKVHRMRWVPPGVFWMGSPEEEGGRWEDEGPRHEVELTEGFWLGETPVTQAQWVAVIGENPSGFKGAGNEQCPVERVRWDDCRRFIERVNDRVAGLGMRLPTEAEWERACRGGTEGPTWTGTNTDETLNAIAWWGGNGVGRTHPVRGKVANPYGLHDMLGNVWEWCEDAWPSSYEDVRVQNPLRRGDGTYRVIRGGSWSSSARDVRAAYRLAHPRSYRYGVLGFRLARGQGLRSGQAGMVGEGRGTRPEGSSASTRDAARPGGVRRE